MKLLHIVFILMICILSFKVNASDSTLNKMILIPAGDFMMGSTYGPKDEQPVHRVHVDSFYLGISEVTIWEYLQCVQSGNCRMPYFWNKQFFPGKVDDLEGKEWLNLPVTGISWEDAQAYCRWKGEGYRLPTEAEWEYAARGRSGGDFFWGNRKDSVSQYAVIKKRFLPVKTLMPNQFGIYDILGNVWEWCEDRYDPHYYKKSPINNPCGPDEAKKYPCRVARGGSWNEYIWNLRCANRHYGESFRRYDGVGFRICRSVTDK
ncbi:MAG: formylglycine-generating enzyme family protein [Chitinispirillaceae bacterium]|nr:formylglycine-generating enzyme family protein [Chitinispirillaceae bacterium]